MSSDIGFFIDPGTVRAVADLVAIFLIVYFFFLIRMVLEMIRFDAPGIVIVFGYLSLIPVPPFVLLGVAKLILWHFLRRDLIAASP